MAQAVVDAKREMKVAITDWKLLDRAKAIVLVQMIGTLLWGFCVRRKPMIRYYITDQFPYIPPLVIRSSLTDRAVYELNCHPDVQRVVVGAYKGFKKDCLQAIRRHKKQLQEAKAIARAKHKALFGRHQKWFDTVLVLDDIRMSVEENGAPHFTLVMGIESMSVERYMYLKKRDSLPFSDTEMTS